MADPLGTGDLTYSEVGATARPDLLTRPPTGFRVADRWRTIGRGDDVFRRAAHDVARWGMQRGSGIRVLSRDVDGRPYDPGSGPALPGDRAVMRIGLWPIDVPVLVVATHDEPDRVGFTYGTLPGHPECGEEVFEVVRVGDEVVAHVRSFSRPGTTLARVGAPVLRVVQEQYTRRYLRALPLERPA